VLSAVLLLGLTVVPQPAPAQIAGCVFQTAPGAVPAFCDTFDRPFTNNGTRSGALDGVVWGVSRATSHDNPSQRLLYNWSGTQLNLCGTMVPVLPPNDVAICNGQLVESINDNSHTDTLAMYPRQPFDIAGRTGTVVFDVGDDSQGSHAAWPGFIYTDQPVPAPGPSLQAPAVANYPRNSFGFTLAGVCPGSGPGGCGSNLPPQPFSTCVSVDSMVVTANYRPSDVPFSRVGCVIQPSQFGQLNHFEVRLSQNEVQVWASDAGQQAVRQIAQASNVPMPLTRGLIWIAHWHYNAGKSNTQRVHTFAWDNVGFDGPIMPRDLGFDVPDNTLEGPRTDEGLPTQNLGYTMPGDGNTLSLQVTNVSDVNKATAALLEFNYWPRQPQTITYSLNGNPPQTAPWPFGSERGTVFASQTIALPVIVSQIQAGTNTFTLSTSDRDGTTVANVDLILVAAGALATGTGTSDQTRPAVAPPPPPTAVPPPPPDTPPDMAPPMSPDDMVPPMSPDDSAPPDDAPPPSSG